MIVSITGGTGFIGAGLVAHHCALGDEVRIVSRRAISQIPFADAVQLFHGDLARDDLDLREFVAGANILYHCAGELSDTGRMSALHLQGTSRLIKAAEGNVGRWVQLSSVGVYGRHKSGIVTEDTPLGPVGMYEMTKAASDELVLQAAASGAFALSILRPGNVFGPQMRSRSLFQMIEMIERGLFFFIGKPGARLHLVSVKNIVKALELCGRLPEAAGRTYIVADSNTVEACVSTLANALGKPLPRMRVPELPARLLAHLPGLPLSAARIDSLTSTSRYSSVRIERELGYQPVTSTAEGLQEMVAVWQARRKVSS